MISLDQRILEASRGVILESMTMTAGWSCSSGLGGVLCLRSSFAFFSAVKLMTSSAVWLLTTSRSVDALLILLSLRFTIVFSLLIAINSTVLFLLLCSQIEMMMSLLFVGDGMDKKIVCVICLLYRMVQYHTILHKQFLLVAGRLGFGASQKDLSRFTNSPLD